MGTYIEKIATFAIVPNAAWTDYDLFTLQGVPKGAIAEIVCANKNTGAERTVGVRTDGSGINRYISIHEAEGDGVTTANMFVKCDSSTGLIECYSEIGADCEFYLLGYFDADVDFTEKYNYIGDWNGNWADKDVSGAPFNVPANAVCQVLLANPNDDLANIIGIRANGSGLERTVTLDEAEGGGKSTLSMIVKVDADSIFEWKGSIGPLFQGFYLLGWFSSNVDFTEGWTEYVVNADTTWESKTIIEADASSIVAFALVHEDSGKQTLCGLRSEGGGLNRYILEHEAEGGGNSGFQACITLDADKKCEVYCQDANEANFYYSGYFTISVGGATYEKTWEIDAVFQRLGIERGRGYDAAFQLKGIEKTPDIDTTFLLEGIERTADIDSLFVLRPELQRQVDATFKRLGIEKLPDFDVAFQLTVEKTPDFDALFLLRHELLRQVDVVFKRLGIEKTPDFDTAFQLQGIEKTPDFDALFMLRIELLRQLDVVFRATIEKAPDYDVAFQLQDIPKTFDIDTLIVLRTELQRTIDTAFQRTIEKTPDFDALFVLRLELARGYDAAFQRLGIERARGYDTAFQLQGIEKTSDFDSVFSRTFEETPDFDAAFQLSIEKTPDIDSAFLREGIERTPDVDVAFQRQGIQKTPDFDTTFQLVIEKTPDFDALFVLRVELARGYDAAFQRQDIPRTFGLDVQFGVAVPVVPPPPITGRPLVWPPELRQIPFTERLILFGRIRRLFIQDGRLDVAIRRAFSDEIVFSATAVKRIAETVSMGGFIVTDDIPDHAWEALFEAVEKEMEEEELVK